MKKMQRLVSILLLITMAVTILSVSVFARDTLEMDVIYAQPGETYEITCLKDAKLWHESLNRTEILYDSALYAYSEGMGYHQTSKYGYWPMNKGQVLVVQVHEGIMQLYGDLTNCFTVKQSNRDALYVKTILSGQSESFTLHSVKTFDMYDYFKTAHLYYHVNSDSSYTRTTYNKNGTIDGKTYDYSHTAGQWGYSMPSEGQTTSVYVASGNVTYYGGYRHFVLGADYTAGKLITRFGCKLNDENYIPTSELNVVSRYEEQTTNIALHVYENKNGSGSRNDEYVVSEGATVVVGNNEYKTNGSGIVKIPTISDGTITVSKPNYISRTITAEQLQISKVIYLQPISTGRPVVSAVWVDNTDVLSKEYSIDLLSDESIEISVVVDWGKSTYGSIALMQDERTMLFTETKLSTVLKENFDISETIFIVAKDTEGNFTKKELKFEVGDGSGVPEWLNELSFDLGDSLSVTLPKDIKPKWMAGKEVGTGLSSTVPLTVTLDNGKVYVAIGADLSIYEKTGKWATSSFSGNTASTVKTKNFITELKETGVFDGGDYEKSLKKLRTLESTYGRAIKYPQGQFGFNADFRLLGFAEGYCPPGTKSLKDVVWMDTGLVLNPSMEVSTTCPIFPPLLINLEGKIKADIMAQFNLYLEEQAEKFMPDGQLSGTLSMSLGLGTGIKHILYGSGGVKGELNPLWKFNYGSEPDYFKLTATGKWYGNFNLLFMEFPIETDPWYEEVWLEYPSTQRARFMTRQQELIDSIYDISNYQVKDLSYLKAGTSEMLQDRAVVLQYEEQSVTGKTEETLKTNIYRQSTPQIVAFEDGEKLAVWLDGVDSDINSICLYYSYFNGTQWGAPMQVYCDGTIDNAPSLVKIEETAYLVWQNATKKFSTADTLSSVAPYFDISLAVFDSQTGFITQTISCDGIDMMPQVCGNDEKLYVVWSKNSANNWFGTEGMDAIYCCEYTENGLSEIETVYEGIETLTSFAATCNEELEIAYCAGSDGDTSTLDDIKLYVNGIRFTATEESENDPYYYNGALYWNRAGTVVSEEMGEQDHVIGTAAYQVLESGQEKVLLYVSPEGITSTLCASYYNVEQGAWCNAVKLTDGKTFIGAFSAAVDANGNISVLVNEQNVDASNEENPYGESTLNLITIEPYCDLSMGELLYSADTYSAGAAMEFVFDLTNNGSNTVFESTVELIDEVGEVLTTVTINEDIVPGQTIEGSVYLNVAEDAVGEKIRITATPNNMADQNLNNNSHETELRFEDLCVEQARCGMKATGELVLSANIVNYGYHQRSDILVELHEGSIDGELVESKTVTTLGGLDLEPVVFELEEQDDKLFFITITDSGDTITANDHDYIAVFTSGTECITIDRVFEDGVQLYLENQKSGKCIVAVYDEKGKMLTCGMTDVAENVGEVVVPCSRYVCDSNYTVKVFLLDSAYVPICKCVVKRF